MKTTRSFGLACILTAAMATGCGATAGEENIETESAKILADVNAPAVLTAKLPSGYTIATSLQVGSISLPYFLLYNKTTGVAVFEYMTPDAKAFQQVGVHAIATGWTSINAFAGYDGQAYLLFYNALNGAAYIEKVNANAAGMTYVWSGTWAPGFTSLATYQDPSSGAPKLIAYNKITGAVHLDEINPSYNGTTTRYAATWPKSMNSVVPYRAGFVQRVLTTNADGLGTLLLWGVAWTNDSMFEIGSQPFSGTASVSNWTDNGVQRFSSVDSWIGKVTLNEINTRGYTVDQTGNSAGWQGQSQLVLRSGSLFYQLSYRDFGAGIGATVALHLLSTPG